MPTYEYVCKSCGKSLEVQQRFTDDPLTECPSCEGPLRKVFGNVGISFKGSGFYKTDSRGSSKSSASSSAAASETTSTPSESSAGAGAGSGSTDSSSASSSKAPATSTTS